ncbi:MAG: glycosyltransferase family 39 protein [bacterium]
MIQKIIFNKINIVVILCGVFVFLGSSFILNTSQTYDEAVHLTTGYSYLTFGKAPNKEDDHPPLFKKLAAIPLLFMDISLPGSTDKSMYNLGYEFLYTNNVSAGVMLNSGRFIMLFCGLILGICVFLWSKELYGFGPGVFSLFIYVLYPGIIAHSSLVTTDLGIVLGYFVSIYCLYRCMQKPGFLSILVLGLTAGIALMAKFSGILILPVMGLILLYGLAAKKISAAPAAAVKYGAIFLSGLLCIIILSYGITQVPLYFSGFMKLSRMMNSGGRISYLCGKFAAGGWKYFFTAVFLLKTPAVFILLLVFITGSSLKRMVKNKISLNNELLFLVFPALVFFFTATFSKFQIGHRHILPIYPFLMVWMGSVFHIVKRKKLLQKLLIVFAVIYSIDCLHVYPYSISYITVLTGGSKNGYKYLIDSNVDWGHGLKALGAYLKKQGVKNIYLSYFGTADPHYYGIGYLPVGFFSDVTHEIIPVDISAEKRRLIAISVTNLQAAYYTDKTIFKHFRGITPQARIADSIFVYDLDADRNTNRYLQELFKQSGNTYLQYMQDKIID